MQANDPLSSFEHVWIDKGSPRTLLLLHGTGGDEHDLVPLAGALEPEMNILSPRGRVSEGGANRFFRRFAEGVFDEENLRSEASALAEFVGAASERYGFSVGNLLALGFSNGANMAASLLLLHPVVLNGGILIRGMVPLDVDPAPDLAGKRALLLNGATDPLVPVENARRLAAMLASAGAEVAHNILPTGHQLTREDIELAKAWL